MSAKLVGEFSGRDLAGLTCEETVDEPGGGWRSYPCGRKAKAEIRPDMRPGATIKVVCGLHLAAHNRRAAKVEASALAREERASHNEAMAERLTELGIRLGLVVDPFREGPYPGRVSAVSALVSIESLEYLADRFGIVREETDAAVRKLQAAVVRAERAERERDDALDRVAQASREIGSQAERIAELEYDDEVAEVAAKILRGER